MIVEYSEIIINYFSELNLNFSKPQAAHLLDFISMIINIESNWDKIFSDTLIANTILNRLV